MKKSLSKRIFSVQVLSLSDLLKEVTDEQFCAEIFVNEVNYAVGKGPWTFGDTEYMLVTAHAFLRGLTCKDHRQLAITFKRYDKDEQEACYKLLTELKDTVEELANLQEDKAVYIDLQN